MSNFEPKSMNKNKLKGWIAKDFTLLEHVIESRNKNIF